MRINRLNFKHTSVRKLYLFGLAVLLVAGTLFPLIMARNASALQMGNRFLQLSNAIPGSTSAEYTFSFVLATLSNPSDVEGLGFQACTTAVGTCTAPTGLSFSSATFVSQSGSWQGATNFAVDGTGQNGCVAAANVLCANRTNTTDQTTSTARTITFGSITNPTTANSTFFVRITTYGQNDYTVARDTGVVAAAVVQTLTVSAAVAEVLQFCIGSTAVDDGTTSVGANCAAVSGTLVNIGVLDTSQTNVSPVDTADAGNDLNGVAMLRTNAFSGATIDYEAIQQSGSEQLGTLRINGASCNAVDTTLTDQCIRAQGTTQATFTPGTDERFGMTIGAVNPGSTTSYTCTFVAGNCNLVRDAAYDGNGTTTYTTDTGLVAGTTDQGYAWDASGTSDRIAASTSVVDDEALILKFAAYPAIVTPFGSYSAQADFIAIATY